MRFSQINNIFAIALFAGYIFSAVVLLLDLFYWRP